MVLVMSIYPLILATMAEIQLQLFLAFREQLKYHCMLIYALATRLTGYPRHSCGYRVRNP